MTTLNILITWPWRCGWLSRKCWWGDIQCYTVESSRADLKTHSQYPFAQSGQQAISLMLGMRKLPSVVSKNGVNSRYWPFWGGGGGESTGHRWIPFTRASNAELWCFFDVRLNKRPSKKSICDLSRHGVHNDVTVMRSPEPTIHWSLRTWSSLKYAYQTPTRTFDAATRFITQNLRQGE